MFQWLTKLFRPESKPVTPGVVETPAPAVSAASSAAGPSATPPQIPRVTKLNLDAGDFLPITREERLEAGRQQVAHGLLPQNRLQDLVDQKPPDLGRVRVRLPIHVRPDGYPGRAQFHPGQGRCQGLVGRLHESGVESTGHR